MVLYQAGSKVLLKCKFMFVCHVFMTRVVWRWRERPRLLSCDIMLMENNQNMPLSPLAFWYLCCMKSIHTWNENVCYVSVYCVITLVHHLLILKVQFFKCKSLVPHSDLEVNMWKCPWEWNWNQNSGWMDERKPVRAVHVKCFERVKMTRRGTCPALPLPVWPQGCYTPEISTCSNIL